MSTAKPTVYEALKAKLGREPTHKELCEDVLRILHEVNVIIAASSRMYDDPREQH
jgi:hypothetical protein